MCFFLVSVLCSTVWILAAYVLAAYVLAAYVSAAYILLFPFCCLVFIVFLRASK